MFQSRYGIAGPAVILQEPCRIFTNRSRIEFSQAKHRNLKTKLQRCHSRSNSPNSARMQGRIDVTGRHMGRAGPVNLKVPTRSTYWELSFGKFYLHDMWGGTCRAHVSAFWSQNRLFLSAVRRSTAAPEPSYASVPSLAEALPRAAARFHLGGRRSCCLATRSRRSPSFVPVPIRISAPRRSPRLRSLSSPR